MIIAVALDAEGKIAHSVEKTEQFKMYETSERMITNTYHTEVGKLDLEAKVAYLKSERVEVLFIETLDDDETDAFGSYSMQAFINAEGEPEELVNAYLEGAYTENLEKAEETRDYEREEMENRQNYGPEVPDYFQPMPPLAGMFETGEDIDECGCDHRHENQDQTECDCGCNDGSECGCDYDKTHRNGTEE